jgi:hypothetical protein
MLQVKIVFESRLVSNRKISGAQRLHNAYTMTGSHPTTTVDPREARTLAALEFETPIEHVTYDENYPPHDLSSRQHVQLSEGTGGASVWRLFQTSHSSEQNEDTKRTYRWVIVFVVIFVAVSVNLGSLLGLKAADSGSHAPGAIVTPMGEFMRNLPAYSLKMAQTNASSPQAKALMWLQADNDYELYRLNQRYALGVLYYSMEGELRNSSLGWMSNSSECEWDMGDSGSNCDDFSRLISLGLGQVTMLGSMPRELELLSDLQSLGFAEKYCSLAENYCSVLSGPIPSEMYVSRKPCLFSSIFFSSHPCWICLML